MWHRAVGVTRQSAQPSGCMEAATERLSSSTASPPPGHAALLTSGSNLPSAFRPVPPNGSASSTPFSLSPPPPLHQPRDPLRIHNNGAADWIKPSDGGEEGREINGQM